MWPEIERVKTENRHELVLGGHDVSERIKKEGLDLKIFDLTGLNYLDIHDTSLESLPDNISKLTHLQSLVLYSNKFQEINLNIAKLDKLKLLDLSRNQLKEIPSEIDKLNNIVTFNFSFNCLEDFPKLVNVQKLSVLNISNNKLKNFTNICQSDLANLSELKLSENEIEAIPHQIKNLSALKVLELSHNKIKVVPKELSECLKLKVLDLKNNPVSDRRLLKLIDQCRIKQILDYVKAHCPKTVTESPSKNDLKNKVDNLTLNSSPNKFKYTIQVNYAKDNTRIIIDESVKSVREHILACLVNNVSFTEETFKKFIQIQNKLHETVCFRRNLSTIATHDFDKLPPGDLLYSTLPPNELRVHPLNRPAEMTGSELFAKLQAEANNLRKEKKRNTYSGIHKYLYLLEGRARYPCLSHSEGIVISFPPITNSDVSKIHVATKTILLEVTSSESLAACKNAMEALLKELVLLLGQDLVIAQIKSTDKEGNLKVVYPSKTDLNFEGDEIRVVRN